MALSSNGLQTEAVQWLERSLDDSANRYVIVASLSPFVYTHTAHTCSAVYRYPCSIIRRRGAIEHVRGLFGVS